jgi:hypothetical protein
MSSAAGAPTACRQRSDTLVGVGVGADAAVLTLVERIDRGDLLGGELEVEDVEVPASGSE